MAQSYNGAALSVHVAGCQVASGAVSARVALVNDSSGNLPRYIRVCASAAAYVKLGGNAVLATSNDMMVQPGDAVIMQLGGADTYIAALQVAAGGVVQIASLDNT